MPSSLMHMVPRALSTATSHVVQRTAATVPGARRVNRIRSFSWKYVCGPSPNGTSSTVCSSGTTTAMRCAALSTSM